MLVTPDTFASVTNKLRSMTTLAVDTETTGLRPFANSRIFGVSISTADEDFYFDYNSWKRTPILDREKFSISEVLNGFEGIIFMHNALFDMHFLSKEGVNVEALKINCTAAIARVTCNYELSLKLDQLGYKYLGSKKDKEVDKYITSNPECYEWYNRPGRKGRVRDKFFYKVPLEIISKYAEKDTRLTYDLGHHQFRSLASQEIEGVPGLVPTVKQERQITKVFYRMDRTGVVLDVPYTDEAFTYENQNYLDSVKEFEEVAGAPLVDSGKAMAEIFSAHGLSYPKTDKGNPCFTDTVLKEINHPLVDALRKCRDAYKRAGTFGSFLHFNCRGVLHASAKQYGCATGRVSYSDPPMQCLEKIDPEDITPEMKYLVRRCIIPRPGKNLVMMDFDQMEYRMMINYAREMGLAKKVLDGLDVHTATAELVGCSRKQAKTVNFLLLYGGGIKILAEKLDLSIAQARMLKKDYFKALPAVKKFIDAVVKKSERRGFIYNWSGRRYYFDKDFSYGAPNYLIQGGCADWMKQAMIQVDALLASRPGDMLLQVHDELLFEIPEEDMGITSEIKTIMENISRSNPHDLVPLTVGVDYSKTNWQDKVAYE